MQISKITYKKTGLQFKATIDPMDRMRCPKFDLANQYTCRIDSMNMSGFLDRISVVVTMTARGESSLMASLFISKDDITEGALPISGLETSMSNALKDTGFAEKIYYHLSVINYNGYANMGQHGIGTTWTTYTGTNTGSSVGAGGVSIEPTYIGYTTTAGLCLSGCLTTTGDHTILSNGTIIK
jgi:hypothetical protein